MFKRTELYSTRNQKLEAKWQNKHKNANNRKVLKNKKYRENDRRISQIHKYNTIQYNELMLIFAPSYSILSRN